MPIPATQSERRSQQAMQKQRRCRQAPVLSHKRYVDVTKCHGLPRKVNVDGSKCHAWRAKVTSMSRSATPATQSERRCHQVPRLPCKKPRRQTRPSAPLESAQGHKGFACHAKATSMSASATPATRLCVKELCVKEPFVTKLCESVVCDKVICDKVVGDKVAWKRCVGQSCVRQCVQSCVCKVVRDKVAGERVVCWRVGGRAGGWTGVRNKKHEPHTKMWGTITIQSKSRHFTFPAWNVVLSCRKWFEERWLHTWLLFFVRVQIPCNLCFLQLRKR